MIARTRTKTAVLRPGLGEFLSFLFLFIVWVLCLVLNFEV